jgi:endoglucanase
LNRAIKRLERISNVFGVSGDESEVVKVLLEYVEPLADSIDNHPIGNLVATVNGSKKDAPSLLLVAHMDEIGLMVRYITKGGFLRFLPVGGWDVRILPAQPVIVHSSSGKMLEGVIGSKPPHIQKPDEIKKVMPIEDLFIDIGVSTREEAEDMGVQIGDRIILSQKFSLLGANSRVMRGKALDDRIGCAVLVEVLEQLKERGRPTGSIHAGFSVQEEVGLRGAGPLAYQINPTCSLAIEGTVAAKTAGTKKGMSPTVMGAGPAITIMDSGLLADLRIVRKLEELAKAHEIPYQIKRPVSRGRTDASEVLLTRGGIPSGVLSIPCRYIHSPNQLASIDDFMNEIRLTVEFCYAFQELF